MTQDTPRAPHRIAGYLALLSLYGAGLMGAAVAARARGRPLPTAYDAQDLLIGAVATHKLTRLISKDAVTTPIRAPFTEFEESAGAGEVNESPRHGHLSHTPGEVLTCPFCLAPWVASTYVAGLVLSPRLARACATTFALVGASDWLQHGYARFRTD
jgi:hypothetical protein